MRIIFIEALQGIFQTAHNVEFCRSAEEFVVVKTVNCLCDTQHTGHTAHIGSHLSLQNSSVAGAAVLPGMYVVISGDEF